MRDVFKKIWHTQGTLHAKMGTIKDRNGMHLTEAENNKKRWQKYTELYRKYLHNPDNHYGVITHLEPDILEWEAKWALGSFTINKASGGDGIPAELLQILKEYVVKVLHSICQQIWKTQQWPQDWKRLVFIPIPKKGNTKECSKWKWKWSRSVVSDSSPPHGLQPTRLFHPWDFPGKSGGVGCHCLLRRMLKLLHNCTHLTR